MLNFHYYELALRVLLAGFETIFLHIYCRVCLHTRDQWRCGKWSGGSWSAEYLESAEKLWMFRRRYIVGTIHHRNLNK